MKKTARWLGISLFSLISGFAIYAWWKPFQPRIDGKKLDVWWNEQYIAATNLSGPTFMAFYSGTNLQSAQSAFYQAGEKGIDYLISKTSGGDLPVEISVKGGGRKANSYQFKFLSVSVQ